MIKSQQVNDMSSREEKIGKIRILLSKAKKLVSKQQELWQKFIEDYVGDETDEKLVDLREDLRVKEKILGSELAEIIIEIAKKAKGLEGIKINIRDFNIVDTRAEAGI